MTMFQPVQAASDRVMAALIASLEIEFGHQAGEGFSLGCANRGALVGQL